MAPFRIIRILLLLMVLAIVAFHDKSQRLGSRRWIEPLELVIYPINGENSPRVDDYIDQLSDEDFKEIEHFFAREGQRYELIATDPVSVRLGPKLEEQPPPSPSPDGHFLKVVLWALHFRLWASLSTPHEPAGRVRVRIFAHYHEIRENKPLRHSLGLSKGLLGIVHAFADRQYHGRNNVVIAHEFLHTVGATDKYDTEGQPRYPEGFADADAQSLYPQQKAEIMAGTIPLVPTRWRMAEDLNECIIGSLTAKEINWRSR